MTDPVPKQFAKAVTTAMHALHHLASKMMKSGSIPLAQYRLLMLLQSCGPVTITELSSLLGIAQSTASELAGRALESGLLIRSSDPADRRRTLYALSPKSRTLLKNRKQEMDKIFAAVLKPLSPSEQERLSQAFETIAELLSRHDFKQGQCEKCPE
jgi:DNA-binding MarR family transcriptional regulator